MRYTAPAAAAFLLASSFAGAASAQTLAVDELFDAAIGDFNRDGRLDLAVLVQSDSDDADSSLFIYLREDAEVGVLSLAFSGPDMLWGTGGSRRFFGQVPSLQAMANGSLAVTEQNYGIGRERWSSTITVAWRDARFVVAGYTYLSFDTLQEEEPLDCDLNLLTGRGKVNDRDVSFASRTIALADWSGEYGENPGLAICRGDR